MSTETVKSHSDDHGKAPGHAEGHGDHAHGGEPFHVHAHVNSFGFLVAIFGMLIVLTFITVGVSYVDLGVANLFVAVAVATVKASLVSIFFMHLLWDKPFHSVILVSSFVFLGVFLLLTFNDIDTRGRVDLDNMGSTYARSGVVAPGGLPDSPIHASTEGHGEHGEGHAEGHAEGHH